MHPSGQGQQGGTKRTGDEGLEPETKKFCGSDSSMSPAAMATQQAAAVAARLAQSAGNTVRLNPYALRNYNAEGLVTGPPWLTPYRPFQNIAPLPQLYTNLPQHVPGVQRVMMDPNTQDYSNAQMMVCEAMINDDIQPNKEVWKSILQLSLTSDFHDMMSLIWLRIRNGTNFQIYKSLLLLDYLLLNGKENIRYNCMEHKSLIENLIKNHMHNRHLHKLRDVAEKILKFLSTPSAEDKLEKLEMKLKETQRRRNVQLNDGAEEIVVDQ